MPFYRLVKTEHIKHVQKEDVEAVSPEEAVKLWKQETSEPVAQYDHGRIETIEMVDENVCLDEKENHTKNLYIDEEA